jgi:enoyl-[acyl-carrier protein] reductase II
VNLILLHPALETLADVCTAQKVPYVVLAGGMPSAAIVGRLKDGGCKVLAFAPALPVAKKLHRMGVDALIIEGSEAGGHIGAVTTSVLAQEILPVMASQLPVFVAGGIGHGQAIAAYMRMGAAGCQLGTRFVCATECVAHPAFKKAFIKASARDAVVSSALDARFPVIPVRALQNTGTARFMAFQAETIARVNAGELDLKEGQLAIEHYWAGALRRAVVDGDVENGSLMAGQSVGMVNDEKPVAAILDELLQQAGAAIESVSREPVV